MDAWIVAAAAYIAQHWKDRRRSGQSVSESSPDSSNSVKGDSSQRPPDKKCPLRRLTQREKLRGDALEEEEGGSQEVPASEVALTSELDGEQRAMACNFEDINALSTSSLLPGFIASHKLEDDQEVGVGEGIGEIDSSYVSGRNRPNLRSKRIDGRPIRPLISLESCLMAQLYKENVEMEEYMLSSFPSPNSMQTVRPFLVIDGSKIISKAYNDSFIVQTRTGDNKPLKDMHVKGREIVSGVPPLPNVGSSELRRKCKDKTGRDNGGRLSSSSKMASMKPSNSLRGSSDGTGTLLFCLGISFGVISSFLANRREVDKLNELLKQTENLVQDLQEELEMKDSLTVKEMLLEDYESQDAHEDSFNTKGTSIFFLDEPAKHYVKESHYQLIEDESLSKIEAELEAELEMLELNMNSTTLERKVSDLVEIDPGFVPDIANGELRADVFGRQASEQPYADRDGSGSSSTHSANYEVSPRELSLRLHEVVQLRLEERVKELEVALENSQRKVQNQEPEHPKPWREFSSSEAGGSSSVQGSPIGKGPGPNLADEPVVLSLAGEALDAYNEACDQFAKIDESEEEDSPSLDRFDQDLYWIEEDMNNHYTPLHRNTNGVSLSCKEEERSVLQDDLSGGMSEEDENEHVDDEMEKLLIKHIVEKARKGSPVVLNAQKALFSMDENAL